MLGSFIRLHNIPDVFNNNTEMSLRKAFINLWEAYFAT